MQTSVTRVFLRFYSKSKFEQPIEKMLLQRVEQLNKVASQSGGMVYRVKSWHRR